MSRSIASRLPFRAGPREAPIAPRHAALAAFTAALALMGGGVAPAVAAERSGGPAARVLVVFLSGSWGGARGAPFSRSEDDGVESALAAQPTLSVGLLSATEGYYTTEQFLLDVSAGARVEYNSYQPQRPPPLRLVTGTAGGRLVGWESVVRRARSAPQNLQPGLLAASIPGLAAYAVAAGQAPTDVVMAAARDGRIDVVARSDARSLTTRIGTLLSTHRLVVADLGEGATGYEQLRRLLLQRAAGELVLALQRAPDRPDHVLLWAAAAALGGAHALTSPSTQQPDLVASVDIPVTTLRWLGQPVPPAMRGRQMALAGPFDPRYTRALGLRLRILSHRRIPTLWWLLAAWAILLGALVALRRMRLALRVIGLSALWIPAATLIPAALEPGRTLEKLLIVGSALILGVLTDRLAPWPRGPLLPAAVTLLVITVDALAHQQLLIRSVLGPNPAFGARFYGIGNELKSGLAVLAFAGVAALLSPAERSRRSALTILLAGGVLAVIEGSARIGAGVGGVILVAAGTAVAAILVWPGRLDRRRVAIVVVSPLIALAALTALDLLTAHGSGHFTGSILHARSADDLRDVIVRRYRDAWGASGNGLMPVAAALATLSTAAALRWRRALYGPVTDPLWRAALAGGLAAGVVGSLAEDSGTVLFVVAVGVLGAVTAYLLGVPHARNAAAGAPGRLDLGGIGTAPQHRGRASADV